MQYESSLSKSIGILALTGLSFLSGCAKEKPIDTTVEFLRSPAASTLIDKTVSLQAVAKFERAEESKTWYQPPPIIVPVGKGVVPIMQPGRYITHTSYHYQVTVGGGEERGGRTWSDVETDRKIPDGPCTVLGTYAGNYSLKCGPTLKNIEILTSER